MIFSSFLDVPLLLLLLSTTVNPECFGSRYGSPQKSCKKIKEFKFQIRGVKIVPMWQFILLKEKRVLNSTLLRSKRAVSKSNIPTNNSSKYIYPTPLAKRSKMWLFPPNQISSQQRRSLNSHVELRPITRYTKLLKSVDAKSKYPKYPSVRIDSSFLIPRKSTATKTTTTTTTTTTATKLPSFFSRPIYIGKVKNNNLPRSNIRSKKMKREEDNKYSYYLNNQENHGKGSRKQKNNKKDGKKKRKRGIKKCSKCRFVTRESSEELRERCRKCGKLKSWRKNELATTEQIKSHTHDQDVHLAASLPLERASIAKIGVKYHQSKEENIDAERYVLPEETSTRQSIDDDEDVELIEEEPMKKVEAATNGQEELSEDGGKSDEYITEDVTEKKTEEENISKIDQEEEGEGEEEGEEEGEDDDEDDDSDDDDDDDEAEVGDDNKNKEGEEGEVSKDLTINDYADRAKHNKPPKIPVIRGKPIPIAKTTTTEIPILTDFMTNIRELPPPSKFLGKPNVKYSYPPKDTLPLQTCFHNPSGYVCCNLELNNAVEMVYKDIREELDFNSCNLQKIANKVQRVVESMFEHPFETVVSHGDFAQNINFAGDLVCKLEIDGKYIIAYGSPYNAESSVGPLDVDGRPLPISSLRL